MENRWSDEAAQQASQAGDLGLRVYSSQLLGQDSDLVLHGGGNTSVKTQRLNVFGESEATLLVKGSGWDLATIEAPGFAPVDLDYLIKLSRLDTLTDQQMMQQLRLALLEPNAPTPSVEAILHALIPYKYVDHSHADAVVAISNTASGEQTLKQLYGDQVLVLPYVMPGFILAKQLAEVSANVDWQKLRGIVLLHHGIISFADDAKTSYDTMIELVTKAEQCLQASSAMKKIAKQTKRTDSAENTQLSLKLSQLRSRASIMFNAPVLARLDNSETACGFAHLSDVAELVTRGPLTPDHTIHTKAYAAVFDEDIAGDLQRFETSYQQYFDRHASAEHQRLDCMPRYGVWLQQGMVFLAGNLKRLEIVQDITTHTIKAMQWGEILGGWQALPAEDLFQIEYWELEQAKLKSTKVAAPLEGKVAVVTGAASGIGRACVEELLAQGAVIIALDIAAMDFRTGRHF